MSRNARSDLVPAGTAAKSRRRATNLPGRASVLSDRSSGSRPPCDCACPSVLTCCLSVLAVWSTGTPHWLFQADLRNIRVGQIAEIIMATENIAAALTRVQNVLQRRPQTGVHDDAPATARWMGGLRVMSSHVNGMQVASDMPAELGGTGDQVSPGWLFRAGLAACLATCIAIQAAAAGIVLTALEVRATSRSDLRGLFGMCETDGEPVGAGPIAAGLTVRIAAPGVESAEISRLVERSYLQSPISAALRDAVPVSLAIETDGE